MRRFRRHDCSAAAGSIAFFAGLSLLPALLVLIAVLGFVFETSEVGRDAESEVLSAAATHLSPSLQSTVRTVLSEVRAGSSIGRTTTLKDAPPGPERSVRKPSRASLTSDRCPLCRLPMVGTSAMWSPW